MCAALLNVPLPLPKRREIVFELQLPTRRSALPSPFTSPTAVESGVVPRLAVGDGGLERAVRLAVIRRLTAAAVTAG